MGANSIEIDINGRKTFKQIEAIFEKQRKEDRDYNGHQEGYSGDFQTVGKVKDYREQVYPNLSIAMDECLNHAQKWEYVVAVEYYESTSESKKVTKLRDRLNKMEYDFRVTIESEEKKFKDTQTRMTTCTKCKSKLNKDYLNRSSCPLCRTGLLSKTATKRILNKQNKISELKEKLQKTRDNEAKKSKNINTLIAGWGAC